MTAARRHSPPQQPRTMREITRPSMKPEGRERMDPPRSAVERAGIRLLGATFPLTVGTACWLLARPGGLLDRVLHNQVQVAELRPPSDSDGGRGGLFPEINETSALIAIPILLVTVFGGYLWFLILLARGWP